MNKVAVVTGGASGIGEAAARRFADDGYHVAILDQNTDRGPDVVRDIGDAAHFFACDVGDASRRCPPRKRSVPPGRAFR